MSDEGNQGLYLPEYERDACGIGMIAQLHSTQTFELVSKGLTMLERMEHRGATGFDKDSGDGAGILTHIPDVLFRKYAQDNQCVLPEAGKYAVGFMYLPKDENYYKSIFEIIDSSLNKYEFHKLFYRDVPVVSDILGADARFSEPKMLQLFCTPKDASKDRKNIENQLYVLRLDITRKVVSVFPELKEVFYFASFSSQTIIYKGQLSATQVRTYYPDLNQPEYKSALAIVHSRFSTNTTPKWKLAQPFRCIAHNGEINTIKGNVNWWQAREQQIKSSVYTEEQLQTLIPVCSPTLSDSGNFDAVLEFLFRNGLSMPHALMMMIPEAYQNDPHISDAKREFYRYHDALMEPWDGPASICFTDGVVLGATVDRNGLRPSRYCVTKDDMLVLASETGLIDFNQNDIKYKGTLSPGKILIADLDTGEIIGDEQLKAIICNRFPYPKWNASEKLVMQSTHTKNYPKPNPYLSLSQVQTAMGFCKEDIQMIISTMTKSGQEPISSMGSDIPLAVLSHQPQSVFNYMKQEFAQVTNPPIDPLRENFYMSLKCFLGGSKDILHFNAWNAKQIELESPILDASVYAQIYNLKDEGYHIVQLHTIFEVSDPNHLQIAIQKFNKLAEQAIKNGCRIIILDNTGISASNAAIPSLLMAGALHQHLLQTGHRKSASIVVCAGDVIESHHVACLMSYGADAVFPAVAIQTLAHEENFTSEYKYIAALNKGLLKVMSKLGISTINGYKGAQTFEALGLHEEVTQHCFKGTPSRISGMTFEMLAIEAIQKHQKAFSSVGIPENSGRYRWTQQGEYHLFSPISIHLLQHSTKTNDYDIFKKYTAEINNQSVRACTIRSLFDFLPQKSISIDEVEPIEQIFRRFATGAMSYGSISEEAHTTLAKAMNIIGGKSNSGEGGEDSKRNAIQPNGDNLRSAIKQVASGRFGVTIEYLSNADEIQIKMAQGAKPGEGGQLPGHKVNETIAKLRHSTPGIDLISPPPHHDIYSIEDLAQLIYDLKNANPKARISVKLVAKAGVGIIASGVAKAKADHILISGFDGGTGASPLSSIMHAGIPWEIGLSETHQTLLKNKLRDRVTLQTDGQIRSGKDIVIATLLGAEEWGIATAALVVSGCILMRKCHLNTCPVGIATQDDILRAKFNGKVEHLINYFTFLATEVREIMAQLGCRTIDEMVGRTDMLTYNLEGKHWKYQNLDLSPILYRPENKGGITAFQSKTQQHELDNVLDRKLITHFENGGKPATIFDITNTDRSTGTMLSGHLSQKFGASLPESKAMTLKFKGSAGQSFGAFGIRGLHLMLEGEANDYVGKGLSGATISIRPFKNYGQEASEQVIAGNVILYGATSGHLYINGRVGNRFAVRNSGAHAVVEGAGDHACEYMTGGIVVVLGSMGKNVAAGMSGGILYVYDPKDTIDACINYEIVIQDQMLSEDQENVKKMIEAHFGFTGSPLALEILTDWNQQKKWFKKIIAPQYQAILEKSKENKVVKSKTSYIKV